MIIRRMRNRGLRILWINLTIMVGKRQGKDKILMNSEDCVRIIKKEE